MKNEKKYVVLLIALFFACGMRAQTYHEVVEKAMHYTFTDSLVQAEQLFRQALQMDPKHSRNSLLFSNLGTVQKRMGKTDEAIESYSMALNITPYATSILLNRGALYLEKGLVDKAYLDYCNVIDLLPENKEARLFRAYIYMMRRQYKEARIDYNEILAKEIDHKSARLGIIMLDQKEGKLLSARDAVSIMINDEPADYTLFKIRANIELDLNHPDAALLDLQEAARLNRNDVETYILMGDVCLLVGKKKEAQKAYLKAIDMGVSRAELQNRLAKCRK